jgi:hypothetical protein
MVTLGRISWDFIGRTISFTHQGRLVCWSDIAERPRPLVAAATSTEGLLDDLLHAFEGAFVEPAKLPPQRTRDHAIVLKPGAAPVAVRPYRYPAAHKDRLERQCAAMLAQGIVRLNDSAFFSPVLLVKKQVGLTLQTTKFGCGRLMSKRRRFAPTGHDDLYKFLVIPFGLSNAPATFQALMDDVLRPILRRFVLVFFDDILIYSKTWADHLRHIRAVLDELRRHVHFIKRSKYTFGSPSVAYLGHIISAQRVAMDPTKVQAIHDWPAPRSARAVRGFLGLAEYYRKFVHDYDKIAAPLTSLLKEGFFWNDDAQAAF